MTHTAGGPPLPAVLFLIFIIVILLVIIIIFITTTNTESLKLWLPKALKSVTTVDDSLPSGSIENLTLDGDEFELVILDEIEKNKFISKNITKKPSFNFIIKLIGNGDYAVFQNKKSYIIRKHLSIGGTGGAERVPDIYAEDEFNADAWKSRNMDLVLKEHFPYHKNNGIVLSEKYFNMLLKNNYLINTDLGFNEPRIIVPVTFNLLEPTVFKDGGSGEIPKIIHQCFSGRLLPECYSKAIKTWLTMNPNYEYRYYDDSDMRKIIKMHFDTPILTAYDKLIPGAFKSDLWRLCAVYLYGGFYADIKMSCLVKLDTLLLKKKPSPKDQLKPSPIDNLSKKDESETEPISMIFTRDLNPDSIYNAFFASCAKNPLLLNLINQIVINVENNDYCSSPLNITGPGMIGSYLQENKIVLEDIPQCVVLHHTSKRQIVLTSSKNDLLIETGISSTETPVVNARANSEIVSSTLAKNISGLSHYGYLWYTGTVFVQ